MPLPTTFTDDEKQGPNTHAQAHIDVNTEVNDHEARLVVVEGKYISKAIADAKGDLLVASGPDAFIRKAVGANGLVLTADSAFAGGVKWAAGTPGPPGEAGDRFERPEDHGAAADGVTDDYTALQAALNTGRAVALKPSATYISRRQLTMTTPGQVIYGNGATIKRPAQVVTTTTTSITSGVTNQITVADASGFRVGDQIVVEQGGTFDASARQITGIAGSVISISGTFGVTLSGTTNVRTGFNQISVQADRVRITDLVLDGNSVNWSWGRWQHTAAILSSALEDSTSAHHLQIDHCTIRDTYGDGIVPGGKGSVIADNWIENMAGRGIVFAGLGGTPVDVANRCYGNVLLTCNTDTAVGGNDGLASIDFSLGGPSTWITGNYMDGGYDGFKVGNTGVQGSVWFVDNEIHNMDNHGVQIPPSNYGTTPITDIWIKDNLIDTCGVYGLYCGPDATSGNVAVRGLHIIGNTIKNVTAPGDLMLVSPFNTNRWLEDVYIEDNRLYGATGSTAGVGINAARIRNGAIRGNIVLGCVKGVLLSGDNTDVRVEGNLCKGFYTYGIQFNVSTITGVECTDNRVVSDATVSASGYGIHATGDGLLVSRNHVNMAAGGAHGIGLNSANQVAEDNRLTGVSPQASITVLSATAGHVVRNNVANRPITDSGTATVKSGNLITAGASPINGVATLVGGTKTVSTAEIRTGDHVAFSVETVGGTPGTLSLGTITQGTSFVINSSSGTDTSTVFWQIVH